MLCALDAQDKIVAVTKDCNKPARLLEKEIVGESGRHADIERILEIQPDLVIAKTGSLFPKDDEEKLTDYGIAVLRYRVLHIDALLPMIDDLGRILQKDEQAEEMVNWINGYYQTILNRVGKLPDEELPTVYFMSMGHMDWTGNNASTGNIRINEAGGRNIAADLPVTVPHVEMGMDHRSESSGHHLFHVRRTASKDLSQHRGDEVQTRGDHVPAGLRDHRCRKDRKGVHRRHQYGKRAIGNGDNALLCQMAASRPIR